MQSIVTLAEAGTKLIAKSLHLTVRQAKELKMALVQPGARRRHGRLDNRADALMQILLDSDCRVYLDALATANAGEGRLGMERSCKFGVDGSRPVADVLKVRLHAARTKVGNFLRHQDRAGALNCWKSLEVCRTVRVGFRRP